MSEQCSGCVNENKENNIERQNCSLKKHAIKRIRRNCKYKIRKFVLSDKPRNYDEYIGCDIYELKIYIESKFTDGMSWENYGGNIRGYKKSWNVDHIFPSTVFDLNNDMHKHAYFCYTNLQPLWTEENLKKGIYYKHEDFERYTSDFAGFSQMTTKNSIRSEVNLMKRKYYRHKDLERYISDSARFSWIVKR